MEKCWYADQYKAIRTPKCGCDTCWAKWFKVHPLGEATEDDIAWASQIMMKRNGVK